MRIVALSALFAFLADQVSKYVVIHMMELARIREINVFPPILNFIYGENHGINFGLGGSAVNAWVWIVLALAICGVVLWWVRGAGLGRLGLICAGFLTGGALGNVLDRLIYGYVLDFLNMSCCGFNNPFVFNVADIFVFAGAIGLVFLVPDPKKDA